MILDKPEEHNHFSIDIKPEGKCPACDLYWKRQSVVTYSTITPVQNWFCRVHFYDVDDCTQDCDWIREDK